MCSSRKTLDMSWMMGVFLLWLAAPAAATADDANATPGPGFDLENVAAIARDLASKPYQKREIKLPEALQSLSYDQYRAIRFNPERALWRDQSLFELQFFHPGFIYKDSVQIHTLDPVGNVQTVPYATRDYILGKPVAGLTLPPDAAPGHAGFRIHFPLNNAQYKDEVVVFQGASYFRLVGPGQVYGLSARGLALNTAENSGEEFPRFEQFWLQTPAANATSLVLYALLDSPSVAGAYRFELRAGVHTEMEVEARLFPRSEVRKMGIAPLTSMFFFGENSTNKRDDYRPEVHDSDGLLMETGQGERIWRPLNNPVSLRVVSFSDENPRGFGLMQRDREFEHYLDAEAHYHHRPSLWVQPLDDWGKGRVELVEIPSDSETNDNIVAYWVPDKNVRAGEEWTLRYRLLALNEAPDHGHLAQVHRTLNGWAHVPGTQPTSRDNRLFIIDFTGEALASLSAGQELTPQLQVSSGKVKDLNVAKLPGTDLWRASFQIKPNADQPIDMRLFLTLRDQRVSEVWNYVWSPEEIAP